MRLIACCISAVMLAGCASDGVTPESVSLGPRSGIVSEGRAPATEADRLLLADQEFAAKSLELGAPAAFHLFMDEQGMQLPAAGNAVIGRDQVRAALAQGPPILLSWEPRYAEVLAEGWGWTWGEWQAHEPGAGGRRVGQGKYVNLWKKQADGSWKVRLDIGNTEPKP